MNIFTTGLWLGAALMLSGCGAITAINTDWQKPEYVATGDVSTATYDPGTDTLTINSLPFDDGDFEATYARSPAFDVNGFKAYMNDPASARRYIAYWGVTNNGAGSASAGVVATGNYLNHGFSGATYGRDGTTPIPQSGVANFTGRYAGLLTYDGKGGIDRTSGDVTLDVDFADAKVEGGITNRVNITTATAQNTLILATSTIKDGKITGGTASSWSGVTQIEDGTYEGIIGGIDGMEIAGIVVITDSTGAFPTKETGAFVTDSYVMLP